MIMTGVVGAFDPATNNRLFLSAKAFLRGALSGDQPTVAIIVKSDNNQLAGHFELTPRAAQTFAEYIRQEAELASVAEEENL